MASSCGAEDRFWVVVKNHGAFTCSFLEGCLNKVETVPSSNTKDYMQRAERAARAHNLVQMC